MLEELGPGVTAEIVNGTAEIHIDVPAVATHLGIPVAEAEKFIDGAVRNALTKVYGDKAIDIPIETRYDL